MAEGNVNGAESSIPERRRWRRNEHSHRAILEAAVGLLEERGYDGVTIEGIAERAGVGKQTIYRWWPSKGAVVMEAYSADAAERVPVPDTGAVEGDLIEILSGLCGVLSGPAGRTIAGLIGGAQFDPELAKELREGLNAARRAVFAEVLERGLRRGELRGGLDVDLTIDAVYGAVWSRLLLGGAPLDEDFATGLVELTLRGALAYRGS